MLRTEGLELSILPSIYEENLCLTEYELSRTKLELILGYINISNRILYAIAIGYSIDM